MSDYWRAVLQDGPSDKSSRICQFCGKNNSTPGVRRQHEALHVLCHTCEECPGKTWSTRQRARRHDRSHTIKPLYHQPKPLADQRPILDYWKYSTPYPTITLRRVQIPERETQSQGPAQCREPQKPDPVELREANYQADYPNPLSEDLGGELSEVAETLDELWDLYGEPDICSPPNTVDLTSELNELWETYGEPHIYSPPDVVDLPDGLDELLQDYAAPEIPPPPAPVDCMEAIRNHNAAANQDLDTALHYFERAAGHLRAVTTLTQMQGADPPLYYDSMPTL